MDSFIGFVALIILILIANNLGEIAQSLKHLENIEINIHCEGTNNGQK